MKKLTQISNVLLAATVLLAGCGDGDKAANQPTDAAKGSKEKVKLSIWHNSSTSKVKQRCLLLADGRWRTLSKIHQKTFLLIHR